MEEHEVLSDRPFKRLSPYVTQSLIKQTFTPEIIKRVEVEAQAYFPDSDRIGSVLYHQDGKGPEKPYRKPEGSDLTPEVQAIAGLGVQYHYWNMLADSLREGKINLADILSFDILILHMNADDSSFIETNTTQSRVTRIAEEQGDAAARYPAYITQVNLTGDMDFYNSIKVGKVPPNVPLDKLGLSEKSVEATYRSWQTFNKINGNLYDLATRGALALLPPNVEALITKELDKGGFFRGQYAIGRILYQNNLEDTLDVVQSIIEKKLAELPRQEAFDAIDLLEASLLDLYETAKLNRQDIYYYH